MNKLSKLTAGIKILLRKPSYINKVLEDNEVWKKRFVKKYGSKFINGFPVVDLSDIVGGSFTIEKYSFLDGGSLPTDYALLSGLAQKEKGCDYFEIGTWRGESAFNILPFVKSCTTFNLSDDEIRNMGYSERMISEVGVFIKNNPKIKFVRGNTWTYDFSTLGKYDLVFIDGDHHYASVVNDTKKVFAHLLKSSTIIVWHDYTYSPDDIRYEVFLGILDSVDPKNHDKLFHVRNTNCAVFFPEEKFKTEKLEAPGSAKYNFRITVEVQKQK